MPLPVRVILYARHSSEHQRDASIDDPLRLCRERSEREGWRIVDSYSDRSISGGNLIRPGIQALMQDAQAGQFDMVAGIHRPDLAGPGGHRRRLDARLLRRHQHNDADPRPAGASRGPTPRAPGS